jgi:TonB family protein
MRKILVGAVLSAVCLGAWPAAAADVITNPNWVRRPSSGEIMGVFPADAYRRGISGRATIKCEVSTDGLLRKCVVVDEKPPGMGFGAAALALTPQFRFKPMTVNGQPVAGQVVIPINFDMGGARTGSMLGGSSDVGRTMVLRPDWVSAPSRAEVDAAYPKGETGSATVLLRCVFRRDGQLYNCSEEKHDGSVRFIAAAKSLIGKFRAQAPAGETMADKGVDLLIHFDPPGAPPDNSGVTIAGAKPGSPDFDALYPAAAKAKGVKDGRASVECRVDPGGVLADCKLVREDPPGLGFGEAALKMAGYLQLNLWTTDGRPVDGARITIPLHFVAPEPAPPPPDAKAPPKAP